MPRTQRTEGYPPEYEQVLFRAVQSPNGELRLPMPSYKVAVAMKSKLYSYFSALRKAGVRQDLINTSDQFSMRCEPPGEDSRACLVIFRKEDSWDAQALRDALGLTKGFADLGQPANAPAVAVSPTAHAAMLDKLAEIRKRK